MTSKPNDAFSRLLAGVTGAHKDEAGRVILAFFALHFLLISYYLVKPLRNSQFLKEFAPETLPMVTFGVVIVSFIFTKIFSFLADRVEKYRLVAGAYVVVMILKLVFGQLLLTGSKAAVVAFYFFGSTYFLLAIATMWACNNDIFTPDQGERCYGFIAVGSSTGGIVGSWISGELAHSSLKDHVPECSALSMAVALGLLMLASRKRRKERQSEEAANNNRKTSQPPRFWSDLGEIVQRPYVRRIGLMVLCLAIFNNSLDYISNRAIDREVTRQQFALHFPYLGEADYATVYTLKRESASQRTEKLKELAMSSGYSEEQLSTDYKKYQGGTESLTREVFSDIYSYQGLLGIVLLLVVARLVFRYCGVRFATVILPIVAAVAVAAFVFPLGLLAVQGIMVVVGSANYSLNNAAKELLYTASDEDTKFKHKPLIEGPGMRFGDVLGASVTLTMLHLAGVMGWSEEVGQWMIYTVLLLAIAVWLRAAYLAGREYDTERRKMPGEISA